VFVKLFLNSIAAPRASCNQEAGHWAGEDSNQVGMTPEAAPDPVRRHESIRVEFFDTNTYTLSDLAHLALRTGCPVVSRFPLHAG
jgi:hypothetical protein